MNAPVHRTSKAADRVLSACETCEMPSPGWRHRFLERPWVDVRDFEAGVFAGQERGQYLLAIIDSVLSSTAADVLAVTTSMHDLVVVARPLPDPPMDVIIVRAPGSVQEPANGFARIDYVSVSGRDTRIDRPEAEAVRLFWRFVEEEFGIKVDH